MAGRKPFRMALLLAAAVFSAKIACAQKPGGSAPQPPSAPQPNMNDTTMQPSSSAVQPQQPSKQETKAIKAFRDTPDTDADKKTQLAEDFIEKYPQSHSRWEAVNWLARAYMVKGQVDKFQAEGEKELALTPNNPASLAVLGSNMARTITANTPDMQKHLDQAEQLCNKALDAIAAAKKPEGESDEKFTEAKNQTSAVAYSGLGTVAFRKGKYGDAEQNMEQAIKLGGGSDPVNYYILGKSYEAQNNFSSALGAYNKCAAIAGGMQAPCKASADEMKKEGGVAPK